jgi:hypothetical protein
MGEGGGKGGGGIKWQSFYEENEEFGGTSDLSTFVSDFFAAFFASFFATFFAIFFAVFFASFFAAFFAIFDILVCLAIRCVPQSKSPNLGDVASPMSRGDEIKLAPITFLRINAASAQVQATSTRVRFSFSLVILDDTCMASLAYCRNRSASPMTAF